MTAGIERLRDWGEFEVGKEMLDRAVGELEDGLSIAWLPETLRRSFVRVLNHFIEVNDCRSGQPIVTAAMRLSEQAGRLAFRLEQDPAHKVRWLELQIGELKSAWYEFVVPGSAEHQQEMMKDIERRAESERASQIASNPRKNFVSKAGESLDTKVLAERIKKADTGTAWKAIRIDLQAEFSDAKTRKPPSDRHLDHLAKKARDQGLMQ